MDIRDERHGDALGIYLLHTAAFGGEAEARIIDTLRGHDQLSCSLVATADEGVLGHVAFSPVAAGDLTGWGLAPVAVASAFRRRGIAAQLIGCGLDRAKQAAVPFAVVLGDPSYYSRFGFAAAAAHGLEDEFGGGAAFQALELAPNSLVGHGGTVRYHPAFDSEAATAGTTVRPATCAFELEGAALLTAIRLRWAYPGHEDERKALRALARRQRGFSAEHRRAALAKAGELYRHAEALVPAHARAPDPHRPAGSPVWAASMRTLGAAHPGFSPSTCSSALAWAHYWVVLR